MNARRRANKRAVVIEAKTGPCVLCDAELPPECMHLDHVTGEKLFTIGSWWHTVGIGTLRAEIAKCRRVCPNCHALIHHFGRQGMTAERAAEKIRKEKGRVRRRTTGV